MLLILVGKSDLVMLLAYPTLKKIPEGTLFCVGIDQNDQQERKIIAFVVLSIYT